jgi:hypothetical protein
MSGSHFRSRSVNAAFPYQVVVRSANRGLIELMDNYCSRRLISSRTRHDMRNRLRYCFATPALADEFWDQFGGDRVNVATRQSPDASILEG